MARAVRGWARAHPAEYTLVYGSPVPGYQAPVDSVGSALRVSMVGLSLVRDAYEAGEIARVASPPIPRVVHADLASLRELIPGVPDEVCSRALAVWTQMFGTISFELFGHLHGVIEDRDAFFDLQMARTGAWLVASRL